MPSPNGSPSEPRPRPRTHSETTGGEARHTVSVVWGPDPRYGRPMNETGLQHGIAKLDADLHYVEAGDGPLVLLLHGFPEFWYSWRRQLRTLADAGFHAVAPDMRGYNTSEKPPAVEDYTREKLVGDVADLIDHFGADQAAVIGHDWGGVVSWLFAMDVPEKLSTLAILNCPHPLTMAKGTKRPRQMLRSWYMTFFQLPVLPEFLLGFGDFAVLRRLFRTHPVREGAFSDEDIDRYVEALAQPGARTATINYYRAAARHGLLKPLNPIDEDVLVIWGEQDAHLLPELADPPANLVPNVHIERLPDASHWVQNDRPERVDELLVDFL